MATLGHAYAPEANVERGHAAEHIHGFHVQPSVQPRVRPRPSPIPDPVLSRIGHPVHANPFGVDATVTITSTAGATVTDVHVAQHGDDVLKLAGVGGGQYEVPVSGRICVSWLGDGTPEWTWTIIPADPGEE